MNRLTREEADDMRGPNAERYVPWVERRTATGRSVCRQCGRKIAKGSAEIVFPWSFTDGGTYNSWTAVECHIHLVCEE